MEKPTDRPAVLDYASSGARRRRRRPVIVISVLVSICILGAAFHLHRSRNLRGCIRGHIITSCASNLRAIGLAMYIYAQDYEGGDFPTSSDVLVREGPDLPSLSELICPATPPTVGVLSSYVIVPGQTTNSNPGNVLAFERASSHTAEVGLSVLFVDSHVRWLTPEKLVAELARTYDNLALSTTQPTDHRALDGDDQQP